MVGNTYPYRLDHWMSDIKLAHAHGFDGFALNVGREEWQRDRVGDCYSAALQSQLPFKLFLSFDMTSIPATCEEDVKHLAEYLKQFASHPNQFLCKGKTMISTFAGENSTFGCSDAAAGWKYAKKVLNQIVPVYLVPSFFIDPAHHNFHSVMDGYFNWNGSWPIHLTPESSPEEIRLPKLETDHHHLRYLGDKTFMAAVSPWFFTHYGPDSWNKNWIYRGDDWLFVRKWEKLIGMRDRINIVQLISWNDYGESHYVGPIKGAQPNSQAWVDGYPHEAWLHLNAYFIRAFKQGFSLGSPTLEDRIFVWARPHPKDAWAPDSVPRPTNWQLTDDNFWVVVLSTREGLVKMWSADDRGDARSYRILPGLLKLSHPLVLDGGMGVEVIRDGNVVARCNPEVYKFQSQPGVYNFNAFVAMSS
ncbi:glycoside hydrolase family 71 protein [Jaapia argillacea MUCL 33604]|uniref:Glycoside hydrolase family 71 protein n=1 Tax=Jaapia argillacea MUCL 33604 TaxID=933084 RepID=A0A067PAL4_9AGAM|nr:glycoside hydrolase family 71 protein [Jaapia argillacea MUCL 33604]